MEDIKEHQANQKRQILDSYVDHVLEHGREPASIYKFAKSLGMEESEFYGHYTSFGAVKESIWNDLFDRTLEDLEQQEVYKGYTAREKFLGFFFTWIEELKKKRSYLLAIYGEGKAKHTSFPETNGFKGKFKAFAKDVVLEGRETDEIADRPYITDRYDEALWLQVMFVFQFWLRDTSPAFEKTDAAIEKSVNLAFDLMGKSALDSFVDFAKFLYTSKK